MRSSGVNGVETFREFVLFAHNGIRLLDAVGTMIKTSAKKDGKPADHEDTGEKGYNYRSERFFNRLQRLPLLRKIFDSAVYGDPATPLLTAYTGERVMIRLLMPADKPRNTIFLLHGHHWLAQTGDVFSNVIGQGAISMGGALYHRASGRRFPASGGLSLPLQRPALGSGIRHVGYPAREGPKPPLPV